MQQPDQDKLNAFLGRMVGDLGSAATGALVCLGDRLGLFKAMQDGDKMTAAELAQRTGTARALRARVARRPGSRRLRGL